MIISLYEAGFASEYSPTKKLCSENTILADYLESSSLRPFLVLIFCEVLTFERIKFNISCTQIITVKLSGASTCRNSGSIMQ